VFRRAVAAGGAWIPTVVLVEVAWVLRVAYKFDRATTAAAVRRFLGSDGVTVENEPPTLRALAAFEAGQADFSDYLILETARRAGALPVHTFDEYLARAEGAELVPRA
jgi:predicted nucleic-acid-binding protein